MSGPNSDALERETAELEAYLEDHPDTWYKLQKTSTFNSNKHAPTAYKFSHDLDPYTL
jgi:hypothetical protein